MLADDIHPNAKGKALIAEFFNTYFDNMVDNWNGQKEQNVSSITANTSSDTKNGAEIIRFDGSRIEMLSRQPLAVWPIVTIDAASPNKIKGCFQVSRASSIGTVADSPAVRRIELLDHRVAQDWSLTITRVSSDQKAFDFTVKGSITGYDGNGTSTQDFISRTQQFRIEPDDWMVERAFVKSHLPLIAPFEVRWAVAYICGGEPEVIHDGNGEAVQYRYVLGTGLPSGSHTVRLLWPKDILVHVTEYRVYRPSLAE